MKVSVVALIVSVQSTLPEACPFNCRCTKYKIFCRDSRMRSLPQGRPTTTLVTMEGDVLGTLNQSVVSKPGLENLTTLELIGTNTCVIESHTFIEMRELESLTISKNNITDLQSGANVGLDKLIQLDLSSNELTDIWPGVLEGLIGLRYLELAGNNIKEIHSGMFDGLRRDCSWGVVDTLRRINLYDNSILKLEDGAFRGLCFLKSLLLYSNMQDHSSIALCFKNILLLPNLEITEEFEFGSITTMVALRGLINLRHLKIVSVSSSKIQKRILEDSKLLRKLFIVSSRLGELEFGSFQGLQPLSELDLSHYGLSSLPERVFQDLTSLQKLDLILLFFIYIYTFHKSFKILKIFLREHLEIFKAHRNSTLVNEELPDFNNPLFKTVL